jgi:hypothetical protein
VTTDTLAKLREKMIDIREKKGQKLADLNDEIQIDGAIAAANQQKVKSCH